MFEMYTCVKKKIFDFGKLSFLRFCNYIKCCYHGRQCQGPRNITYTRKHDQAKVHQYLGSEKVKITARRTKV